MLVKFFHVFIVLKKYVNLHSIHKKKGAKILHISEGSGIKLEVSFVRTPRIRKSSDIFSLDELAIKGIQARGNKVSNKFKVSNFQPS